MIEFSGCGQENKSILNENNQHLVEFLSLVTNNNQLRSETTKVLEKKLSEFGSCPSAITKIVGSATDGLFFSLLCSELKIGSRIGVTAYSFHASASCILRSGYIPVFIDVDNNGLMDLDKLEKVANNLDGLIVVQLFGNTVNEEKLLKICNEYNIKFIEDAAQRHTFSLKLLNCSLCISSVLSFDPNKIFSGIGSGGAVVTQNTRVAEKITSLRYHGNGCLDEGYNSQISESSAWLIKKKIENYDKWKKKKNEIAKSYIIALSKYNLKLKTLVDLDNIKHHSLHKFVIVFENTADRNYIEKKLSEENIKTMVHYRYILPELPRFMKNQKFSNFVKSKHLSNHSLSLPMHPFIKHEEVLKIINSLSKNLENL